MTSLILAKILGLYYLGVGLAFIVNTQRVIEIYREILKNPVQLFLGGIIALLIGSLIVSVHNVWVMGWPVLITIIGWLGILKGFGLLIYPNSAKAFSFMMERSETFYKGIGLLLVLLGFFLSYHGWQ